MNRYPDRWSEADFAIPKAPGVRLYGLDEIRDAVERTLKRPLGTAHIAGRPVALRLVVQDNWKNLHVLWSGTPPNGDLGQPVHVLALRNGAVYGLGSLTSKGDKGYRSPFAGHAIALSTEVARVSLDVPVFAPGKRSRFVGRATFKDVPVIQIDDIESLADILRLNPKGTRSANVSFLQVGAGKAQKR